MMDLTAIALSGLFALSALVLAAHFTLKAWAGWLELKKMELASSGRPQRDEPVGGGSELIELADLKARVRKLEAIASGIDL